jgi:transposase
MSQEKKKGVSQVLDLKYSVGIDISKDKFDVCISVINTEQWVKVVASSSFSNETKGFACFVEWSDRKCKGALPIVFTMEATGIYYERLAFYLDKHQKYVSVVLPNKSKHYFQSLGLKSKNDSIDAQGLSRLSKWDCPDVSMMNLRSITRQRESLQETRTQINNQLLAYQCSEFAHQKVLQQLSNVLELLDQQIKETEGCIKEEIAQDPDLKKKVERITQVKGLGMISVATVIAETNGFKMFANQRQLVSFAGYDVVENQSGKHIGKTKISKKAVHIFVESCICPLLV